MKVKANRIRKHVVDMVFQKQSGHIGGCFSIAELIAHLYSNYNLVQDKQDKLILSKGHAVPIIYAALYELGHLKTLENFREVDSPLQGHPDRQRLKFMHATTGALGQGLSIAIGHAIAYQLQNKQNKIFCVLGDGELQEGQIWEAFMLAPKFKLDNLICFIDHNKAQNDGYVSEILDLGSIEQKVRAFNWNVVQINGHDEEQIATAIENSGENKNPTCIILDTIKGKGVSFMETPAWHSKAPNKEEYDKAIKELTK